MLKFETIDLKVNNRNLKKISEFKKLPLKIGDIVNIPISILDKGSHVKVMCICDKCGTEKEIMYQKYIKNIENGGYYSCSSKCSQQKVKMTSIANYGHNYYTKTEEYKERVKKTNIDKYGSEYYLTSNIGKNKISKIMVDSYGCVNPFSNEDIKSKISKTNLEKYGVNNPSKSLLIREKIGSSNRNKWNLKFKNYYLDLHNLDIVNYSNYIYTIYCDVCCSKYDINRFLLSNRLITNTVVCTNCNPSDSKNRSGYELQIFNFIKSIYSGKIQTNVFNLIPPYEIDIYLPQFSIAIEFNGLYWHSDVYKEKDYHYKKHKMCKDNGIQLFQIWEDDWLYKQDIIKSILRNKMKLNSHRIYSSRCKIGVVSYKEAESFLEKNHLQGNSKSKINIGLYKDETLVSLMTFGKLRKPLGSKLIGDKYELYRFCSLINTNVIGSASKLLSYFINNYKFDEIVSYYDKSFGYKSFYELVGFDFSGETPINYHYVKSGIRLHRYNFRKDKLIKLGYSSDLTESQITRKMGLSKIYGAGHYKYILKNKKVL